MKVDLDNATASVRLTGVAVADDHDGKSSLLGVFPPGFPQQATVDFEVEWSGVTGHGTQEIRNDTFKFFGQFTETTATIRWSVREAGFEFVSEEPNPANNVFSVIGHELNGVFFPDAG